LQESADLAHSYQEALSTDPATRANPVDLDHAHSFIPTVGTKRQWAVFDHQLSYDLRGTKDDRQVFLISHLRPVTEQELHLKGVLTSEGVRGLAPHSGWRRVRGSGISKGYKDGESAIDGIRISA
jgi:hypothetical protein